MKDDKPELKLIVSPEFEPAPQETYLAIDFQIGIADTINLTTSNEELIELCSGGYDFINEPELKKQIAGKVNQLIKDWILEKYGNDDGVA